MEAHQEFETKLEPYSLITPAWDESLARGVSKLCSPPVVAAAGIMVSAAYTGTAEPAGYGSSAFGEYYSGNENSQSPGRALVKHVAKSYHQNLPAIRKNPFAIHRLSFAYVSFVTKHIGKDESFLFANSYFKELC